ncbi:ADP-ribosylglycohydrolase family protein [Pyxidicoccus xibeiensis]|uniref:ADP-ribosylglycohydrolase family protein n=1 Tax=Pyxidicoccus xibeiensis TaxID=2906759 RepID=UPI0020A7C911|nr:ADP-ribosylglycohydrolase family protein [Pyxidicoccus xibeiensis]MCP3139703.1 ADP-ribosylglycohydrolase family protein [Pyxidicoccus xibeiensis]
MERAHFLFLMALGDSYGMKYEFAPHPQDRTAEDLVHGPHPTFTGYTQGHYTDDTQLSLANLELLLRKRQAGQMAPDADECAAAWLEAFQRDPRPGYSKHMWAVLSQVATAGELRRRLDPKRGVSGGSAMRAGPFGLLGEVEEVKRLAAMQARVTHDTTAGVNAAQAVALAVHFLHHGGARGALKPFIAQHLGADWNAPVSGFTPEPGNGLNIVTQALRAVTQAKTALSEVLLQAVNNDAVSDTDTVCAIAMGVASRARDLDDDLPRALVEGLERGAYGAAYLRAVDARACQAFPPTRLYADAAQPRDRS